MTVYFNMEQPNRFMRYLFQFRFPHMYICICDVDITILPTTIPNILRYIFLLYILYLYISSEIFFVKLFAKNAGDYIKKNKLILIYIIYILEEI